MHLNKQFECCHTKTLCIVEALKSTALNTLTLRLIILSQSRVNQSFLVPFKEEEGVLDEVTVPEPVLVGVTVSDVVLVGVCVGVGVCEDVILADTPLERLEVGEFDMVGV